MTTYQRASDKPQPRRSRRAAALVAALFTSSVIATGSHPLDAAQAPSGADVDLVFASTRNGDDVYDLWTLDGTGPQQLIDHAGQDTFPRFSPDGTRIAWSKDGGNTTNGRLWVADADGSNAGALNSFQTRFAPAWSPDGTQIAVIGVTADADFDLHLVAADGSGATKLADTSANETNPTWGTFGIALVRGSNVVVLDPSTGADVASFGVGSGASALDAHPTEPLIVFSQAVSGGRRVAVLDVTTGVATPLTDGTAYDGAPAWSPDGTSLAFNRTATLGGDADLWVMDADGSGQLQITSGTGSDITPDWRPGAVTPDPASITVEPSWGAAGNWTTVSSAVSDAGDCGFPAGASIDITWDGTHLEDATADAAGCFTSHVFLDPERLQGSSPGIHTVAATAATGEHGSADYEQVVEELRLVPIVAGPGAPVAVNGCGWPARGDVVLAWFATGAALGTVRADESGCLDGVVDLPDADPGFHTIAAGPAGQKPTGPGGTSATALEIAPASFVFTPQLGPPGARVAAIGCSWFAGEQVEMFWTTTGASLGTVETNGLGCLTSSTSDPEFGTLATIRIPIDATEGVHVVRGVGLTSGLEHEESLTVVLPELVFDPTSGHPGDVVAASGCGWNGNTGVRLEWGAVDPNGSKPAWLAPVDAVTGCFGDAGSFTFEVPDDTRTGDIVVTAEGDARGETSAVFTVHHDGTISAPATAEVGETITVQVRGAIVGELIDFTINGFVPAGVGAAVTTDFDVDVTIPLDSPVGDVELVARGTRGFADEAPIAIPNPSQVEVVSAEPIFAGRRFEIAGSGFVPDSVVTIGLSDDPAKSGVLDSVRLEPDSTTFTATMTVPADRTPGTHALGWSSSRGRVGSVDVEVDVPPFDAVADEAEGPVIDGVIDDDEWDLTSPIRLGPTDVAFQSDDVRLYVLVNVRDDDASDPGDGAALLVDVDQDGSPTPGVDRRFRVEADGNFVVEKFSADGSYVPVGSLSPSTGATSVDCFSADGSLTFDEATQVTSCALHRAYEFAIDLDSITAEPDEFVFVGVEIDSTVPAIDQSFPDLLPTTMHGLGRVRLAPSQFATPLPTGTLLGIGIDGFEIEVTQAVQDDSNGILLVADKPTAVRVYPDTDGDAAVVVRLFGERGGQPLPGSPLALAMTVPDTPDRERIEDSANFLLPESWTTAGSVLLRASVGELDGLGPQFATTGVTFQERRVPGIWYVPLNPGTASSPDLIAASTIDTQLSYFETVLPIAAVDWTAQPWTVIGANVPTEINDDGDEVTDLDEANKLLNGYYLDLVSAYSFAVANGNPAPFEIPMFLYGFTPDGGGLADAPWGGGGGVSASGFWGTSREGTLTHEINHLLDGSDTGTWGRHVTDDDDSTSNSAWGCAAEGGDPNWPRRAQGDDQIGLIGFDTRAPWHDSTDTDDKTVVPADIADFMSYCQSGYRPTKWISPYRWQRTFLAMEPPSAPLQIQSLRSSTTASIGTGDATPSSVAPAYYISGEIRVDGTGSLDPVVRQSGIGTERIATGSHRLVLLDAAGEVVDTVELAPTFVDVEGETREVVFFQTIVPSNADVAVVELVGPQGTLDRIEASPNPPTLDLPVLDGSWSGLRELSWSASDPDGDPLTFSVRYSPDGDRWYPVASGLTEPRVTIDAALLVGGAAGRFSVTATDGLNTTAAITGGSFTVAAKGPTAQIVTPDATEGSVPGAELVATGFAHEMFGARVDDARLVWLVDGEPVGRGRSVRFRAPAETYLLQLVVVDDHGAVVATDATHVGADLPPSITRTPSTQRAELSDAIVPITIVATDPDSTELALAITDLPSGLQAGTVECSPSAGGTACRVTISGVPDDLGEQFVSATADDGTTPVSKTASITVVPEQATVLLHPGNPIEVAAELGVSGDFRLSASVRERDPDVAAGTPLPGEIDTATVTIDLEPVSGGPSVAGSDCVRRIDDELSDGQLSDGEVLTVTCSFDAVPAGAWAVVATASGGYTGRGEDVLAVSDDSVAGAVTGGGSFAWPDSDDVTRFTVSVATDSDGRATRGGVAMTRTLPDGSQHVLRSNALHDLWTSDPQDPIRVATVTGRATYLDPAIGEAEGNHRFVLWVDDASSSGGGPDRAWIRVVDASGRAIDALSLPLAAFDHAATISGDVVVSHGAARGGRTFR